MLFRSRTEKFKALVGRIIPLDNCTRWNSWYEMLIVLLDKREQVEKYVQNHEDDLEEDVLNFQDWKKLRTIKDFLAIFSRATLFTEGSSTSIDSVLFTMDILIKHFQNTLVSSLLSFLFKSKTDYCTIGGFQKKERSRKQRLCSSY